VAEELIIQDEEDEEILLPPSYNKLVTNTKEKKDK
jgi:hypothetical protein